MSLILGFTSFNHLSKDKSHRRIFAIHRRRQKVIAKLEYRCSKPREYWGKEVNGAKLLKPIYPAPIPIAYTWLGTDAIRCLSIRYAILVPSGPGLPLDYSPQRINRVASVSCMRMESARTRKGKREDWIGRNKWGRGRIQWSRLNHHVLTRHGSNVTRVSWDFYRTRWHGGAYNISRAQEPPFWALRTRFSWIHLPLNAIPSLCHSSLHIVKRNAFSVHTCFEYVRKYVYIWLYSHATMF